MVGPCVARVTTWTVHLQKLAVAGNRRSCCVVLQQPLALVACCLLPSFCHDDSCQLLLAMQSSSETVTPWRWQCLSVVLGAAADTRCSGRCSADSLVITSPLPRGNWPHGRYWTRVSFFPERLSSLSHLWRHSQSACRCSRAVNTTIAASFPRRRTSSNSSPVGMALAPDDTNVHVRRVPSEKPTKNMASDKKWDSRQRTRNRAELLTL